MTLASDPQATPESPAPASTLLSPADIEAARQSAHEILDGLTSAILGQEKLCRLTLVGCLARGHVLLEGLPGLGKTELVKSLSKLLAIDFKRLQFTPDLLPGDVTGGHILEEDQDGSRGMVFHHGPVFTNVLLADEINRASPKTQSALLEAMQERRVTVLGETRDLPNPFYVIATQNPIELEGTYPLPEAQLDRFLFKLDVERPDTGTLERILTERRAGATPELEAVANGDDLAALYAAVESIHLPRAVARWIARLIGATHADSPQAPEKVRTYVRHGASPRAAIAIGEAAARTRCSTASQTQASTTSVRSRFRRSPTGWSATIARAWKTSARPRSSKPASTKSPSSTKSCRARFTMSIERLLATVAALIAICAGRAHAEGDYVHEFPKHPGLSVRVWCPWPSNLDKGYLPIFVRMENLGDKRNLLDIEAVNNVARGAHRVERSVWVEPGDRISIELFAPVSAQTSSSYNIYVTVDGHETDPICVVGANEYPTMHGHGLANTTRAVALFTDTPPEAAELAGWAEGLSWATLGHNPHARSIRVTTGATPQAAPVAPTTPANNNVQLVTAPLIDVPRRSESLTSLDLVILDLERGPPTSDRTEALFTWVRQGGVLVVGGVDPDRAGTTLTPLVPWLEDRFRLRSEAGFRELACGLGRVLLVFSSPLATEIDRQRIQDVLLDVNGWVPDLTGSRWDPDPNNATRRWIPQPVIPDLDNLPFQTFTVLLILFALFIGPLNFALVRRLGRPVLLLVTIPSIAIVCSGAVIAYGIFGQGVDVKVAAQSLTVLDQREHRSTSAVQRLMFAGLSPGPGLRPGAGTVCFTAFPDQHRWNGSEGNLRINDQDGTLLAGDYIPVRRRSEQVLLSDRSARGRLVVNYDGTTLEVQNGLGTRLERLLVRASNGALFQLQSPLSPDETTELVALEEPEASELAADLWPVEVPVGRELLPPAAWLAEAHTNPFGDDCGIEVNEVAGRHRLFGILPLDATQGGVQR